MIVLAAVLFIAGCICGVLSAVLSVIPQEYKAYIVEYLASYGSNKENEITLFYNLLIVILLGGIGYYFFLKKREKACQARYMTIGSEIEDGRFTAIAFLSMFVVSLLIMGQNIPLLLVTAFLLAVFTWITKRKTIAAFVIYIISFLTVVSVYRVGALWFSIESDIFPIVMITLLISVMILLLKEPVQGRILLVLQIVLPFAMICYLTDDYQGNGMQYQIAYTKVYTVAVWAVLLLFVAWNGMWARKKWSRVTEVKELISITTCMTAGAIFQLEEVARCLRDLHHPGENLLSYTQLIEKGLSPYVEYHPVSGLFSVVFGAFAKIVGQDYLSYYSVASLFCLVLLMIIVIILQKFLPAYEILFLATVFSLCSFPTISRTQFIPIILLLVFLPGLKKKSGFWQVFLWVLFSLFMGLYYPLYGVAYALGMLPFVIYIIRSSVHTEGMPHTNEKRILLVCFLVLGIVTVCFLPLLYRMACHILLYSAQSRLADGIAVLGTKPGELFFPYLAFIPEVRDLFYYALWYSVPVLFICIAYICVIENVVFYRGKKLKEDTFLYLFTLVFSGIAFSYTINRAASGMLERTLQVLVPLIPIVLCVGAGRYAKKTKQTAIALGMCAAFAVLYGGSHIGNLDQVLKTTYTFGNDFRYVEDNQELRLGEGIVPVEYYDKIVKIHEISSQIEQKAGEDVYYLGLQLGNYYINDLKVIGQPSMIAMKSKETVAETIAAMEGKKCVIFDEMNLDWEYALFAYLMTSDDIYYIKDYDCFVTKELAKDMEEQIADKSECTWHKEQLAYIANSLGKSYQTYGADWIFNTDNQVNAVNYYEETDDEGGVQYQIYDIHMQEPVVGKESDFIHLELDAGESWKQKDFGKLLSGVQKNATVTVQWEDSDGGIQSVESLWSDGDLLIPLGVNASWLSGQHEALGIVIITDTSQQKLQLNQVTFLKSNLID